MTINNKFWQTGLAASALLLATSMPALAIDASAKSTLSAAKSASTVAVIDGIDFGDDSSAWATDGECDDPRFEGPGTAVELIEEDLGHDATDCSALYQAGEITLLPEPGDIVTNIDFGDNLSEWANDGECDDPRFDGPGTHDILLAEDMAHDANDCRALFLAGDIVYLGDDPTMEFVTFDGIDFGDNTSEWANDVECDDPRFRGNGMADVLVEADVAHDANDCLALYQNGEITLAGNTAPSGGISAAAIDFGDDTSAYANDGECDDPRFEGPGVASLLLDQDLAHDATDCSTLFASGQITLIDGGGTIGGSTDITSVDFGDDTSTWANDGECDDPRFTGPGAADILLDEDLAHDATDCRTLFQTGQITLIDGGSTGGFDLVDFGDDQGRWSQDGECDDPRFFGDGMAVKLVVEDILHDASDCRALYDSGQIELTNASNFDFGDDNGPWVNDIECDDPRFIGDGMAIKMDPLDVGHDASDCQAAFNAGTIEYAGGFLSFTLSGDAGGIADINFGDDTSAWSHDGECDDPRFAGPGTAATLLDDDLGRDATDCRTLYEAGEIYLVSSGGGDVVDNSGIDFGDNTSDYADDSQCDDPRFAGPGVAGVLLDSDLGHDANDCRALYNAGEISLLEDILISFGDDTSSYANDGECDDPRFGGKGVAATLLDGDLGRDATDCRSAFEAGQIYLVDDGPINFGDNTSEWANDDECDDPRFAGPGSAGSPLEENLMHDANDCRALYRSSQLYLL